MRVMIHVLDIGFMESDHLEWMIAPIQTEFGTVSSQQDFIPRCQRAVDVD